MATRNANTRAWSIIIFSAVVITGQLLLLPASALTANMSSPVLRFSENGTFRFAMFCDMHFGESEEKDGKSVQFEKTILSLEKPDLVIIDGDASSNYAAPNCTNRSLCEDFFKANWRRFTKPMIDSGTAYAYGLGNHDRIPGPSPGSEPGNESSYAVSDHLIMSVDQTNHVAATRDGPRDIHGASNYVVPVLGQSGRPAFYVWILDSSDNDCLGETGWGCVYPDQVEWFRNKSAELLRQNGRVVPGMAFLHIPLPEVMEEWDTGKEVYGVKQEAVCCSSVNTGLFAAFVEEGNVLAVFSGHDHGNDFVAKKDGILIGYGRKSGYGGYSSKKLAIGARIVELREATNTSNAALDWETYIRLESGGIEKQKAAPPPAERTLKTQGTCGGASFDGLQVPTPMDLCKLDGSRRACRLAAGLEAEL